MTRRGMRDPLFLFAVFAIAAIAIGASFFAYSLQPPRPSRPDNVVFSGVVLSDGNASFTVESVSGGPYPQGGFRVALIVNDFSSGFVPLAPNNSTSRVTIGPNLYRIEWTDANGDGAVDVGDSFRASGDGGPLPSLSYFELDLQWQTQWTVAATWSTS